MIQDGLAYDDLLTSANERQAQSEETSGITSTSTNPRKYDFIMNRKRRASDAPAAAPTEAKRKKPRLETAETQQTMPEATEAVRPRPRGRKKSTVARAAVEDDTVAHEREMTEVEAKPSSPVADVEMTVEAPARPTSTLETGHSVGVQSEPVSTRPSARTIVDLTLPGSQIIQLNWSRSDPSRLTATGDSVWRSWNIPPTLAHGGLPIEPAFKDHTTQRGGYFVSAAAFAKGNEDVAVAVEKRSSQAEVILQSASPATNDQAATAQLTCLSPNNGVVISMRWSLITQRLAILSAHDTHCKISVYDPIDDNRFEGELTLPMPTFDIEWVSNAHFVICGPKLLLLGTVSPKLQLVKKLDNDYEFSALRYDRHTKRVACVDIMGGELHLLNPVAKSFELEADAHDTQQGGINAVEWQPLQQVAAEAREASGAPRILATASPRGTINLWDARPSTTSARASLQLLQTFVMGDHFPAQALSFSPDGQLIAAAGLGRICIWRAVQGKEMPLIEWEAPGSVAEAKTEGEDEDGFAFGQLSWNASGEQLAYSNGERLRVVAVEV